MMIFFRHKPTSGEKHDLQKMLPNVFPQISGILEKVNRQLLLILKTNDLMRGIEYCLGTGERMDAFKVMSECCIRSVYEQRILAAATKVQKFQFFFLKYWILFRLHVYYSLRNLKYAVTNVIYFRQMPFSLSSI